MSFNELNKLPTEISRLKRLEELHLGGNQLITLPEEIETLKENLTTLGLASENFESKMLVNNPIPQDEAIKIQGWLPNTKIIFVWN